MLVWLAPLAFAPFRGFAMEHDTVNFALAISGYDIALHQPQPTGFPYWVLMLKAVSVLPIGPFQAQTLLAFLFTLSTALWWRRIQPEDWSNGLSLMLFSPVAWLFAASPATYAVDLAFSCAFLALAVRAWNGDARAALRAAIVVGLWSGFRSASAVFMLPLFVVCAWRARALFRPLAAFALLWLAWYVPVVALAGGDSEYSRLLSEMTGPTFAQGSIFYGAPLRMHLEAVLRVCIYLSLMLAPIGVAAVLSTRRVPRLHIVETRFWLFALLFVAPALLFATLIHGSKPGYFLLLLPLAAALVVSRLRLTRTAVAASVAVSVALSFAPYERVLKLETAFTFTRATLRSLFLIEDAQRAIAAARPSGRASILTNRREAPNLRSVQYHFPAAQWSSEPGGCLTVTNPWREVNGARLISSNPVYALWKVDCPQLESAPPD
jgi:hypothetical protein